MEDDNYSSESMSCNQQCLTVNESEDDSEGPITESTKSLSFPETHNVHSELDKRRDGSAGKASCANKMFDGNRQKATGHLSSLNSHPIGPQFYFVADSLALRRDVDRHIDLEEMQHVKFLCAGSNSHIFSATWNDKPVIVKTLQRSKAGCSLALSELRIESELLTRIDHPNVIRILGAGVSPKPFIILERLQDISQLFSVDRPHLFRRRPFTFKEVLQLAQNFADAMKYLHNDIHRDAMIIHRDLKPENLGLNAEGELKLYDFGLCRCVKKRTKDNEVYEMTGNTGSLRYMAPEVVLGQPYNEKVDVYSFAVVMWAIATGREPFAGFDVQSHRCRVVLGGERPKLKKSWPAEFSDLLNECWRTVSEERPSFVEISSRVSKIVTKYNEATPSRPAYNFLLRNMTISSFKSGR